MGPVRSGDRLCQTRLIPRSPDGDNKASQVHFMQSGNLATQGVMEGKKLICVKGASEPDLHLFLS